MLASRLDAHSVRAYCTSGGIKRNRFQCFEETHMATDVLHCESDCYIIVCRRKTV